MADGGGIWYRYGEGNSFVTTCVRRGEFDVSDPQYCDEHKMFIQEMKHVTEALKDVVQKLNDIPDRISESLTSMRLYTEEHCANHQAPIVDITEGYCGNEGSLIGAIAENREIIDGQAIWLGRAKFIRVFVRGAAVSNGYPYLLKLITYLVA